MKIRRSSRFLAVLSAVFFITASVRAQAPASRELYQVHSESTGTRPVYALGNLVDRTACPAYFTDEVSGDHKSYATWLHFKDSPAEQCEEKLKKDSPHLQLQAESVAQTTDPALLEEYILAHPELSPFGTKIPIKGNSPGNSEWKSKCARSHVPSRNDRMVALADYYYYANNIQTAQASALREAALIDTMLGEKTHVKNSDCADPYFDKSKTTCDSFNSCDTTREKAKSAKAFEDFSAAANEFYRERALLIAEQAKYYERPAMQHAADRLNSVQGGTIEADMRHDKVMKRIAEIDGKYPWLSKNVFQGICPDESAGSCAPDRVKGALAEQLRADRKNILEKKVPEFQLMSKCLNANTSWIQTGTGLAGLNTADAKTKRQCWGKDSAMEKLAAMNYSPLFPDDHVEKGRGAILAKHYFSRELPCLHDVRTEKRRVNAQLNELLGVGVVTLAAFSAPYMLPALSAEVGVGLLWPQLTDTAKTCWRHTSFSEVTGRVPGSALVCPAQAETPGMTSDVRAWGGECAVKLLLLGVQGAASAVGVLAGDALKAGVAMEAGASGLEESALGALRDGRIVMTTLPERRGSTAARLFTSEFRIVSKVDRISPRRLLNTQIIKDEAGQYIARESVAGGKEIVRRVEAGEAESMLKELQQIREANTPELIARAMKGEADVLIKKPEVIELPKDLTARLLRRLRGQSRKFYVIRETFANGVIRTRPVITERAEELIRTKNFRDASPLPLSDMELAKAIAFDSSEAAKFLSEISEKLGHFAKGLGQVSAGRNSSSD